MKKIAMLLLVCLVGVAFVAGCPQGNAPANTGDKDKKVEPKKDEAKDKKDK